MSEDQNIQEQPVNDSQQSNENVNENSSKQNIEQTTNHQLQTNMEVNHPHHITHKKKWTEYFLEFFMLFLAVTLGFFAENIREHITENRQVHQYVSSLVSDLQSDIKMYDSSMKQLQANCVSIDTLISDLKQHKNNAEAYYLARKLTISIGIITPNVKTFDQLKSTGSMRFIEHQSILDSISSYYQWVNFFDYWSDLLKQRINNIITTNERVFDATVFLSIYKKMDKTNDPAQLVPAGNPPFMTNDAAAINAVMMHYQYLYGVTKLMYRRATDASAQARHLVSLLQNEYHLENE